MSASGCEADTASSFALTDDNNSASFKAPLNAAPDAQHGLAETADKLIGCVRR
jgi:hypothetical protein